MFSFSISYLKQWFGEISEEKNLLIAVKDGFYHFQSEGWWEFWDLSFFEGIAKMVVKSRCGLFQNFNTSVQGQGSFKFQWLYCGRQWLAVVKIGSVLALKFRSGNFSYFFRKCMEKLRNALLSTWSHQNRTFSHRNFDLRR